MRVGFIGLGDQGAPMARAIAQAEWPLYVWARRKESLAAVADVPHTACATVADLAARCDLVCLCLRDDADVEDILEGGGLLSNLARGSVVANHGTGSPDICDDWAQRARARGSFILDAPVSGGRAAAEAKTLTMMVGGDEGAFGRSSAIFESFATTIVRVGDAGTGQLTKLVNNTLLGANMKNVEEVLAHAVPLGLDVKALLELLLTSSGVSFALQAMVNQMTPAQAPHFQSMISKDIHHFVEAARLRGVPATKLEESAQIGVDGLVLAVDQISRVMGRTS